MEKEEYFTSKNINESAEELVEQLKTNNSNRKLELFKDKTALIVLDMQDYFLEETSHAYIPSAKAIIPNINALIKYFNKIDRPIIFTKHLNTQFDAKLMSEWWKDMIHYKSPLSEINKELNQKNAIIIKKFQYDAFYCTRLQNLLKMTNSTQVVITGVMTHLCCDTTVRSAFVRGFYPIFPIDTTATYNKHFHFSTFLNLTHGFTHITTANNVLKELKDN